MIEQIDHRPGVGPSVRATVETTRRRYRARRLAVAAGGVALLAIGVAVTTQPIATTGPQDAPPVSNGEELATPSTIGSSSAGAPTTAPDLPPLLDDQPPADPGSADAGQGEALRPGAARLVPLDPRRVVDTRDRADAPPAETPIAFPVEGEPAAVVASVSVMDSSRAGSVLLDGRAGVVEAVRLPAPGSTTTNLVMVPVEGDEVTVRSSAGGHLVVDLVGAFQTVAGPVAAGRFVPVAPRQVAELVTAVEGRELDVRLDGSDPALGLQLDRASAVLVLVTADVGTEGGAVQLGPTGDEPDQMLMWSPALDDDRQRRGLALLRPTAEALTSLRYDGGSRLTVDVVGYVTNDQAAVERSGLFVPSGPRTLYDGTIGSAEVAAVGGLDPASSTALITVGPRTGIPGQLGSTVVVVDGGTISLTASSEIEAVVTLLGEFL